MKYKFTVFRGNNKELVQKLMAARGWEEVDESLVDFRQVNFIWKPVNLSPRVYSSLEDDLKVHPARQILLNHFEGNKKLANKSSLIKHLREYYAGHEPALKLGYCVFESMPTSFIVTPDRENR
jgi:hypothetical protein